MATGKVTTAAHKVQSRHSLRSTSSHGSFTDREGNAITEVGKAGTSVPIDLLQSLYLTHPLGSFPSPPSSPDPATPSNHSSSGADHPASSHAPSPTPTYQQWPKSISFTSTLTYPPVKKLSTRERKRILVTGGAGFVGSHLVDRLMCSGHDVVVLDNFFSGSKTALAHWVGHPNFELVRADVVEPFMVEVDQIYHLACPASPKAYQHNAVKTLKTNFLGTMNMLGLAKRVKARFLLSSTSEIYGSPTEHPQTEEYWGNVNCVGPRACYDEGKRVAEALTYGYHRQDGVDVRVARIFNCFGPRMNPNDGRLVSNFAVAALRGTPIEIYGTGQQTRSLVYIHDLVDGLIALMESDCTEPVNLGSEDEETVESWARKVRASVTEMRRRGEIPLLEKRVAAVAAAAAGEEKLGSKTPTTAVPETKEEQDILESEIIFKDAVVDDPPRRKPDISRARKVLGYEPEWTVDAGIIETVRYFVAQDV